MNKKRLITGFMISVIGLLSLSVSFSFAWYASSTRLQVRTINITVEESRDFKISTSPELETFKYTLNDQVDDIVKPDVYKPVSSMFSSLWMAEKAQMPEFRDSSSSENSRGVAFSDATSGVFFSQEFYLWADDDLWVTIDPDKTQILPDEAKNKETAKKVKNNEIYAGKSEDEIVQDLNDLVNCMRISVLVPDVECYDYKIVDPYKSGETLLGGLLDNLNDQFYDTYYDDQKQGYYEIVYGEVYNRDKIVYDEPTHENIEPIGPYSAFNARIKGEAHHFNYEASVANGFRIQQEDSLSMDDLRGVNAKLRIPVYNNVPRKIVLSLYLEGWDKDNINNTMGASFISDIGFKIIREM